MECVMGGMGEEGVCSSVLRWVRGGEGGQWEAGG